MNSTQINALVRAVLDIMVSGYNSITCSRKREYPSEESWRKDSVPDCILIFLFLSVVLIRRAAFPLELSLLSYCDGHDRKPKKQLIR